MRQLRPSEATVYLRSGWDGNWGALGEERKNGAAALLGLQGRRSKRRASEAENRLIVSFGFSFICCSIGLSLADNVQGDKDKP